MRHCTALLTAQPDLFWVQFRASLHERQRNLAAPRGPGHACTKPHARVITLIYTALGDGVRAPLVPLLCTSTHPPPFRGLWGRQINRKENREYKDKSGKYQKTDISLVQYTHTHTHTS